MAAVANFAKSTYRKPKNEVPPELMQIKVMNGLTLEAIDQRAEELGMNRSTYVRNLIIRDMKEAQKEQAKLDFLRSNYEESEQ